MLNADRSFLKPPSLEQKVLRRQFAILEPHLLQVLAAHGVEFAGEDEARRAFLDQDAADAVASRPTVDPREHDEGARFLGAADQRLHALEAQRVAAHGRVGGVARDVCSGLRLGHADGENAVARANRRQQAPLDRLRRVGRDDAGLDADFAQHRHGRDVAALGDFLEHQRGVEDAELGAAIGLRHRHAEHADFRQACDVLPGKRAVHVLQAARLELALGEVAHGRDDAPLLVGELEPERVVRAHGRLHRAAPAGPAARSAVTAGRP